MLRMVTAMTIKNVLIFGRAGQFGRLFARRLLAEELQVQGVDLAACDDVDVIDAADREAVESAVGQADVVLLCIPESAALRELPKLAAHSREGTLFVDIASVKTKVVAAAREVMRSTPIDYLSVHPMFGPSIDFAGGNFVFLPQSDSEKSNEFRSMVTSWGVIPHEMTAEEHDEATRVTQVACHASILAYAIAARQSNLDISTLQKVETPMSRALLGLAGRILEGDPELYFSIQKNDGDQARGRTAESLKEIGDLVSTNASSKWHGEMDSLIKWLGEECGQYSELAGEMLATPKCK